MKTKVNTSRGFYKRKSVLYKQTEAISCNTHDYAIEQLVVDVFFGTNAAIFSLEICAQNIL